MRAPQILKTQPEILIRHLTPGILCVSPQNIKTSEWHIFDREYNSSSFLIVSMTSRFFQALSYYAGLGVMGLGFLCLLGGSLHWETLSPLYFGPPGIDISSALPLVLLGASLLFTYPTSRRIIPIVLGVIASALAALCLIEYCFQVNLDINPLFVFAAYRGTPSA